MPEYIFPQSALQFLHVAFQFTASFSKMILFLIPHIDQIIAKKSKIHCFTYMLFYLTADHASNILIH